MEQERVGKNVFSSEEPLAEASLFAGKKLNRSVFSVRNLIGLKNAEQPLIQVHENSS